jgi:hypothetical protein
VAVVTRGRPDRSELAVANHVGTEEMRAHPGVTNGDLGCHDIVLEEPDGCSERCTVCVPSVLEPLIVEVVPEKEHGLAPILRCPQESLTGRDPMPGRQRRPGSLLGRSGGGRPLVEPTVVVAGLNPLSGGKGFAEICRPRIYGGERSPELRLHLSTLEGEPHGASFRRGGDRAMLTQ